MVKKFIPAKFFCKFVNFLRKGRHAIPTTLKWNSWGLSQKASYVGAIVGILSVIIGLISLFFSNALQVYPPKSYAVIDENPVAPKETTANPIKTYPNLDDSPKDFVIDETNHLMWLKNNSGQMSWDKALKYVKSTNKENFLGYENWRLPSRFELLKLAEYINSKGDIFKNTYPTYWSNDENGLITAWIVDFREKQANWKHFEGRFISEDRDASHSVRLVRLID